MSPAVTAVVMAFNEVKSLDSTVGDVHVALTELRIPFEIIIIDDGSTDGTNKVAADIKMAYSDVRVITHPRNMGLGGVYSTGFKEAKGDNVIFFPADGQFPSDIIKLFYPQMKDLDMVLGYLMTRNDSALGSLLSKLERVLFRVMFGDLPKFQGIMMFKREILEKVNLTSQGRGWMIVMELILRAKKSGYRIKSESVMLRMREHGRSKVNNLPNILSNLCQLARLRMTLR